MFVSFNSTFAPLFVVGLMGQPRGSSPTPRTSSSSRLGLCIAFVLGASMLVFLGNLVWSLAIVRKPAAANPWDSKSLEWQTPTPVPVYNFERIPQIDPTRTVYTVTPRATTTPAPLASGAVSAGIEDSGRPCARARGS